MPTWKIREHKGNLYVSMDTQREVSSFDELVEEVQKSLYPWGLDITPQDVTLAYSSYDKRINWDTYLICVSGYGVWGMADGPGPKDSSGSDQSAVVNN